MSTLGRTGEFHRIDDFLHGREEVTIPFPLTGPSVTTPGEKPGLHIREDEPEQEGYDCANKQGGCNSRDRIVDTCCVCIHKPSSNAQPERYKDC